jgi:hypothetical protein
MGLTRIKFNQINTNTAEAVFDDPLLLLNQSQTGSNDKDAGLVIERGDNTNVGIIWDESEDEFVVMYTHNTGSTRGHTTVIGYANLKAKDLVVDGNLTVNGTTTTLNTSTLDVEDLNLTLAKGAANSAAADGAGITIDGASATITYTSTGDKWVLNKTLETSGSILSTTGTTSITGNITTGNITASDTISTSVFTASSTADVTGNLTAGNVSTGSVTGTGTLTITGNAVTGNISTTTATITTGNITTVNATTTTTSTANITAATISTSTTTGALKVAGGTGIVGNLYVGGQTNVTGQWFSNGNVGLMNRTPLLMYDSDNSNYVGFRAPITVSADAVWVMPATDGTPGQALVTDGAKNLSWAAAAGGGGGASGFQSSTITTTPGAGDDYDLAKSTDQSASAEVGFALGSSDPFGVSLDIVYDCMEPVGTVITVDYGDEEAYIGA